MSLKSTEELCHENEEWSKIWRGIDLPFQNWHEEFDEFWPKHLKASKIFILMFSFWTKYILFELKRYWQVIFHETEEGYKIWEEIDSPFQNWHNAFDKFWPEGSKLWKIFPLMGYLCAKYILFELKKYRGVIFHETEEEYKILSGIDSSFQNWHKEFDKIWPEHMKVSKIFILLGSFWGKYIFFELKKYRGIIFHETDEKYKISRVIDLSLQNLTQALKSLKNFRFTGLLLSKA